MENCHELTPVKYELTPVTADNNNIPRDGKFSSILINKIFKFNMFKSLALKILERCSL